MDRFFDLIYNLNTSILLNAENYRHHFRARDHISQAQNQRDWATDAHEFLRADILRQLISRGQLCFVADCTDAIRDNLEPIGEEQRSLIECRRSATEAAWRGKGGAETGVELLLPVAI